MKTIVLTPCYCAGSGEGGVMKDVKRNNEVDGHMNKNKNTYQLLLCR